jgi:cellulose synthase/poly-beta-1,6-N-acetylglucosamine synthase-like glycosyltransferase
MTVTPAISILLPFYKAGNSLEAAIQSILQQHCADWELLLLNNNADAQSSAIAQHYQLQDARIQVHHVPEQGIAYALNRGLSLAKAPLIARLDADDIALPGRLQKQLQFLQEHPQVGVVACSCAFIDTGGNAEGYGHFVDWQNSLLSPRQHWLNRFVEAPVAHPSVMFRKELAQRWGGYSTAALPEDYELWLRWMSKGVRFAKLPEALVQWHDHPDRLSRTHSNYSAAAFLEVKLEYLARWLQQTGIAAGRKIVLCGASPEIRKKAAILEGKGITIWGYTDVKARNLPGSRFIPLSQLAENRHYYFINLIGKRGVGQQIRTLLIINLGYTEEQDFILAG